MLPLRPCLRSQWNLCQSECCVHGTSVKVRGNPGLTFLCCSGGGLLLGWSRCCSANRHHTRFICMEKKTQNKHVYEHQEGTLATALVWGPLGVRAWLGMARLPNPLHSLRPIIFKQKKRGHLCLAKSTPPSWRCTAHWPIRKPLQIQLEHFHTSQEMSCQKCSAISPFCQWAYTHSDGVAQGR